LFANGRGSGTHGLDVIGERHRLPMGGAQGHVPRCGEDKQRRNELPIVTVSHTTSQASRSSTILVPLPLRRKHPSCCKMFATSTGRFLADFQLHRKPQSLSLRTRRMLLNSCIKGVLRLGAAPRDRRTDSRSRKHLACIRDMPDEDVNRAIAHWWVFLAQTCHSQKLNEELLF
jgi:hypothetical protein